MPLNLDSAETLCNDVGRLLWSNSHMNIPAPNTTPSQQLNLDPQAPQQSPAHVGSASVPWSLSP